MSRIQPDRVILRGVLDTLPLALAVVPWGILTGALAIQAGLGPIQAQLMSLLVFAGAAQLSAVSLLASGAAAPAIMSSVFVISSRHLLYSIVFRTHVAALPLPWRCSIGFLLTDEMFAVSEAHTREAGHFSPLFALSSGLTFYLIWNLATFVGIMAGESINDLDRLGLDFAIVATFIAMTFGEITKRPILTAILVSGAAAVLLKPLLADTYIIAAALLGMSAAYWVDLMLEGDPRDG